MGFGHTQVTFTAHGETTALLCHNPRHFLLLVFLSVVSFFAIFAIPSPTPSLPSPLFIYSTDVRKDNTNSKSNGMFTRTIYTFTELKQEKREEERERQKGCKLSLRLPCPDLSAGPAAVLLPSAPPPSGCPPLDGGGPVDTIAERMLRHAQAQGLQPVVDVRFSHRHLELWLLEHQHGLWGGVHRQRARPLH